MNNINFSEKIKELARNQNISIRQLCQKIGITEAGLSFSLKNNTLKISTLEKISDILGVEIGFFFKEDSIDKEDIKRKTTLLLRTIDFQIKSLHAFLGTMLALVNSPDYNKKIEKEYKNLQESFYKRDIIWHKEAGLEIPDRINYERTLTNTIKDKLEILRMLGKLISTYEIENS